MASIPSAIFGKGHYQLLSINNEKGEPIPRGAFKEPRLRELLERPTGNLSYMAKAALMKTQFQTKDLFNQWNEYNEIIKTLDLPKDQLFSIQTERHQNKTYFSVPLDDFAVLIAQSERNPQDYLWVGLRDAEEVTRATILFYQGEVCIVSNEPLYVTNQDNTIKNLWIYSMDDVVLGGAFDVEQYLNVFCSSLECHTKDSITTGGVNFLCWDQCTISEQTYISTKDCLIRAGSLNHKGQIDSTSTSFIAELIDLSGIITASEKNGISLLSLGLYTGEQSHLHAGKVNILTGAPVKEAFHPFLGKTRLNGLISSRGLNVFSYDFEFENVAVYVQGNINLFAINKQKIAKTAKLFFNGEFIRQHSQFAAWIEGTVAQCPELEVFYKRIIISLARLSNEDALRLNLPRVLVHQAVESLEDAKAIRFLPAFNNQQDYSFKPYDKSQFTAFEVDSPLATTTAIAKFLFSATDYLSMEADFSLTSAEITIQGNYVDYCSHIGNRSVFGLVSLALKSLHAQLANLEFNNQQAGQFLLETKDAVVIDAFVNSENILVQTDNLTIKGEATLRASQQIHIKSEKDSRIEKESSVVLRSPKLVQWECENFYLRGSLDFEHLSIKAERLIQMFLADIRGQSLLADSKYFLSFLTTFSLKKSFSIKSIISLIALCDISSDLYSNSSIVNFSCAFYRPATLSLNGKSLLSCTLAATNTLISVLQLVLHDPTAQLALTLIRVGINAGPALYQAVQLSKAIQAAASKQNPLEPGEIIDLLNQSKVLLLSMGSLAYTGVGIANQCIHFDPFQSPAVAVQTWTDILKDINNVAAPLLGLAFGKRSDNFFSMDADLVFCGADTNFSLFRVQAGWEFSPLTSSTSLGLLRPNPYSFDASPVMSTSTSVWSMSASQETILPIGLHSERTFDKTYIGTGLPTLAHDVCLTTQQLHVIGKGSQSFTDSTIQTETLDNKSVIELTGSTLNVTSGIDNPGEVVLANSAVHAKSWHNSSTGVFLAVNSSLTIEELVDDKGALAQIVASRFQANNWQEQGKFGADASEIVSTEAHFAKDAEVGSRATDWHIRQVDSAVKVGLDFKGTYYGPDNRMHTTDNHPKHQGKASLGLDYVDETKPNVSLTSNGAIQYDLNAPVELKGTLVTVLPLAIKAPQITVYDANVTASFYLNGNVTFDKAHMAAQGSIAVDGGKIVVKGGTIESGGVLRISGEQTKVSGGATLFANGDIQVKSGDELISTGQVKTTTTSHTQKKWFGLSKTTYTDSSSEFTNNSFVSVNGNVELDAGKGMKVTGTDIWGDNILFNSKDKMTISPLMGAEVSDKTHSNLMHKNEYEHVDETASSVHLTAKDKITFSTTSGDFENIGSELSAPNGIIMSVPDTSKVTNTALVLNSYYTETHKGLYFKPVIPTSLQQYVEELPLVQQVGDLAKNHDLSSAVNLATNVINTSQNALASINAKGLESSLANNFLPDLGLTLKLCSTQMRTEVQRPGPGSITTRSLVIEAGEADFLNDPNIQVEFSDFRVHGLKIIGAALTSSVTVQDNSVSCTYSPLTSQTSFGLNHGDLNSHQSVWKGDLHLGNLTLQADDMLVYGSQVTAKIEGHVKRLEGSVGTNTESHSSHQLSMDTSGNFSYSQDTGKSETAAFSELFKGENHEAFDGSQFNVDSISTHGARCDEIKADHRDYEPIVESNKGHSFSIGGSLSDLKHDTSSTPVFSNWNVHASHVDKVHADETMLRNSSGHFGVVAPIYHAAVGNQFLNRVHDLVTPKPLSPTPEKHKEETQYKELPIDLSAQYEASQDLDPAVVFSLDSADDKAPSELDKQIAKNFAELIPKTCVLMGEAPRSVEGSAVFPEDSRPYSEIYEEPIPPLASFFMQVIPPALGADIPTPDDFVSPLLKTALNPFETEPKCEEPHHREYLTQHLNFGILAEVAIEDIERIKNWNHSFQNLVKSSEMEIFLSEMQHFRGAEAAFDGFVKTILNPFCERLFDKASYLYPMYAQVDGDHFLTREVFEERDVPSMVERIAKNVETRVTYFENLVVPLRCFYLFSTILEDFYQIAKGEPGLPLLKEEAYSTIGAVSVASFSQELAPYFSEATLKFSNLFSEEGIPFALKALNLSWKYSCPVAGMILGSLLGQYVSEKDEHNDLDIPLSLGMARQLWDAAVLRERIGAEFKAYVVPSYTSSFLSDYSANHYYEFTKQLSEESNIIGRALMKPIPPELFKFSQIAEKFHLSLAGKFGKELTEDSLNDFGKFCASREYTPVFNVEGDFFRELIEKHSDFSSHTINKYKTMAKTLFAVAAAETLYKLATAENKLDEATKIALSYGAAEAGASVAITAGSALCAANPLCLAGMGLLGGIGGTMLADKGWEQMQEDARTNPAKQLPSFKNIAAFFKPSEYLQGQRNVVPAPGAGM